VCWVNEGLIAAGDGEVVFADADKKTKFSPWNNFYGNVIVIRHADEMYTLYAHLSEILVQVGDQVQAGDEIGKVGQTGGATGSHLHFEVRKGGDYTDYFSTENPELWTLPPEGTGALSITLNLAQKNEIKRIRQPQARSFQPQARVVLNGDLLLDLCQLEPSHRQI